MTLQLQLPQRTNCEYQLKHQRISTENNERLEVKGRKQLITPLLTCFLGSLVITRTLQVTAVPDALSRVVADLLPALSPGQLTQLSEV